MQKNQSSLSIIPMGEPISLIMDDEQKKPTLAKRSLAVFGKPALSRQETSTENKITEETPPKQTLQSHEKDVTDETLFQKDHSLNTEEKHNTTTSDTNDDSQVKTDVEIETTLPYEPKNGINSIANNKLAKWAGWTNLDDTSLERDILPSLGPKKFKHFKEEGWTLIPLSPVLVFDLSDNLLARPLKDDFKMLWMSSQDTFDTTYHATNPKSMTITHKNQPISITLNIHKTHYRVVDFSYPKESLLTPEWRLVLAQALRNARDKQMTLVMNNTLPEILLDRGAHWDVEWIALKKHKGLKSKIVAIFAKLFLSLGQSKRKKLYVQHHPFQNQK